MDKEQKYEAASDEMKKARNEYNEREYKYTAFISYRHVEPDQSIAKQVHQMIETFKAPKEFYQNGLHEASDAGFLLITHYTRILRYIKPDFVHVFVDGRVAEEGGPDLAERLELEGYDRFLS